MTVENNCAIAIATLSGCLKNKKKSCACFSSNEIQNPTNLTLYARLLEILIGSSRCLLSPVVIGQMTYFGIGFSTVI